MLGTPSDAVIIKPPEVQESGGTPSFLSSNVPEPITYGGRSFVDLPFPSDYFKDVSLAEHWKPIPVPPPGTPSTNLQLSQAIHTYLHAMVRGFFDDEPPLVNSVKTDRYFPSLGVAPLFLRYLEAPIPVSEAEQKALAELVEPLGLPAVPTEYSGVYSPELGIVESFRQLAPELRALTPEQVVAQLQNGRRLVIVRSLAEQYAPRFVPIVPNPEPRVALIEEYRLSSFLGNYGAGKTLSTISLLPGEKTRLTVRSYKRTSTTAKRATSILDSFTGDSAQDFQDTLESEETDKKNSSRNDAWQVEASVSGSWGTGSAKVSGGYKGSASSAREQAARNVSKATQKHATRASNKRDVKVEQSSETRVETGEETGSEREIHNVNVRNTLNFVFRQMNQEYVSLLHMTDVQVGYSNGLPGGERVVPLAQLDELLADVVSDRRAGSATSDPALGAQRRAEIRRVILAQLDLVLDHLGNPVSFVEERVLRNARDEEVGRYLRTTPERPAIYEYEDGQGGKTTLTVTGIILVVSKNVLRTDSIIVDAVLGQGTALDPYSLGLQEEAVRNRRSANDCLAAEIELEKARLTILEQRNLTAAQLCAQMFTVTAPPANK